MKRTLLEIFCGLAALVLMVSFHHQIARLQQQNQDVRELRERVETALAASGSKQEISDARQQVVNQMEARLRDLEARLQQTAAGSEVAINSASIALMNNDLRRLPVLVRLSRQTRTVINQNFLLGVLFVIGGLVLAAMKYINPIVAAIMHVAGSLLVVFNSARLVRHGEELEPFQGSAPAAPENHDHSHKPEPAPQLAPKPA